MDDDYELPRAEKRKYRRIGLKKFREVRMATGNTDVAITAAQNEMKERWEAGTSENRQDEERDWMAFFDFLLVFIERLIALFSGLT